MNEDISQEAETALATVRRRKARERLDRDGAQSIDAIRRRVRAIAEERKLQPADFAQLMPHQHRERLGLLQQVQG
jgi:hypothetical protein